MNVYIASDHAGVNLKQNVKQHLEEKGYLVIDEGSDDSNASVDYPDFAHTVVQQLKAEPHAYGILICGTGIGMSIAANRFSHIRAALCHSLDEAKLARQHNNANILCLGARTNETVDVLSWVDAFLTTEFDGGRHQNRLDKLVFSCEEGNAQLQE